MSTAELLELALKLAALWVVASALAAVFSVAKDLPIDDKVVAPARSCAACVCMFWRLPDAAETSWLTMDWVSMPEARPPS